ncbi:MAG: hypothetical protein KJ574_04600, partial [Nanoarchaeota archaeon]|nr:hypothetical protein [Nanoarchaeota archaeon]
MRKIVVLLVVMLFLVSGVSSASIVIPSPFKGVEVKVGASAGEKSGQEQVSPTYCEKKSDCEWVECGCFSKERKDEDVLCPMNTSAKECMCMHNICIPDFMAFFNSKGMNVNKYMRQSFFKPECPKFNYMFFNSLEQSETALLVLAFKDASNFDSFLVQNCGSPFLRQKIDEALGGEFFDPCNGIDFLYSGCAMYKADDCAAWTDSALAEIEWKKTSCEQTFKNCTYHQQIKEDVEKDRAKCLAAPSDYTTACASDCERILLAKDACASQKIDKLQFKQSAYGKIPVL